MGNGKGPMTHYWEIAVVRDTTTRIVLAENVPTEALWAYVAEAGCDEGWYTEANPERMEPKERRALARVLDLLKAKPLRVQSRALLITRMDKTPAALKAKWESEFYDLDKAGRKRRRYKRPQVETDWDAMSKAWRKEERDARRVKNKSR